MMWLIIFAVLLIVAVGGFVYLTIGVHRFSGLKKLGEKHKFLSWLLSAVTVAAAGVLSTIIINVWSAVVIMIHLFIFWAVGDLIAAVYRKIAGKKRTFNISGAVTVVFTAMYLTIGWFTAHNVVRTEYNLTTDHQLEGGKLKIAMFADSHLGITLDGEKFAAQMERIAAEEPDVLIIPGDFVDDDSCRADMVRACAALGEIQPKYGKYFSFGNHDKGYYESMRDFTTDDLREELEKNGVTILEDESVTLGGSIRIIGRCDKSDDMRTPFVKLILPDDTYNIVMDHQPNDYKNEAAYGADLVLSGHTHGGHLFPAGYIGLWMGANDFVYGTTRREQTDFVVTSGISGWALPFKTGCKSEYVIINIESR